MSSSDPPPEELESTTTVSPGQLLRVAREARKLTLQQVADTLHLPTEKVAQLEQDNYSNFPGRTYVRGYLIGYARYVLADQATVEKAFAGLFPATNQIQKAFNPLKAEPSSSVPGNSLRLILVALVVGIALAVYLTLRGQFDSSSVLSNLISPGTEPTDLASTPLASTPVASNLAAEKITPTDLQPPKQSESIGPPRRPTSPTTDRATISTASVPIGLTAADGENLPTTNKMTDPVAGEILLQFAAECWADIRASDGTKLLYNLQPAGSEITLSATLPIKLFLGNATAVKVFYNGELYDHPIRGRIAQFTLDTGDVTPGITSGLTPEIID